MTDAPDRANTVADAARLAALHGYDVLDTAAEPEFDGIVLLARTLCAAPTALLSLVAEERQWFKARSGFGPTQTPLSQSVCAHALTRPGLLVILDLRDDPRTSGNTLVTDKPGIRFYAGTPLRTRDGHGLGTLCVLDTVPRPHGLSSEQAEGLHVLATLTMALLEQRRELSWLRSALPSARIKTGPG